MSSIRLFVLGSLAERGPMHGHALVALAEEEHVTEWTDISVGGLYGAIRRLDREGLIAAVRVERVGNYPERQVYAITDSGREALRSIQAETLETLDLRHDPVDLGIARLDPEALDRLEAVVRSRHARLTASLAELDARRARIRQYLTEAEWVAMAHGTHRLRGEIAWHDELLAALPDIIRDERARREETP
ncbi:PadR family transcriptional regulator [Homoserinibacter sp. GY 40078]|uniref:PadR family transcriptional regulator n=1 Tax=Homoserinibacter sp. GY 40078 TaxID=2603275 RepID=UPI0011C87A77|nr:PadR family transcriptional regulator [Homoserinibacter sp. GY 40078]TXK17223.1 PadR family transcriptional regulator [Homoserinibacter sp. GY 40078]